MPNLKPNETITKLFEPVVNVVDSGSGAKCWIQRLGIKCRRKAEFMIFTDDGKTKSSRLDANVCKFHLADAVIAANKYNRKTYK